MNRRDVLRSLVGVGALGGMGTVDLLAAAGDSPATAGPTPVHVPVSARHALPMRAWVAIVWYAPSTGVVYTAAVVQRQIELV